MRPLSKNHAPATSGMLPAWALARRYLPSDNVSTPATSSMQGSTSKGSW